jgi:hypothetical protein
VDAAALQVKLVEGELYPTVNLGASKCQSVVASSATKRENGLSAVL